MPGQFATIAAALEVAAEDDTVLVAPGTHVGAFDLSGRQVLVGSRFLTAGDTTYVWRTILDGTEEIG